MIHCQWPRGSSNQLASHSTAAIMHSNLLLENGGGRGEEGGEARGIISCYSKRLPSLRLYHIIAPVHRFKLARKKPGPYYSLIGHFQEKPWFAKLTGRVDFFSFFFFLNKQGIKTGAPSELRGRQGDQQEGIDCVYSSSKWAD